MRGGFRVFIKDKELDPAPSQAIYNHSPDGFSWGYAGSGPAQLALAILLYFTSEEYAIKWYQQFKFDIISGLERNAPFQLPEQVIHDWVEAHP